MDDVRIRELLLEMTKHCQVLATALLNVNDDLLVAIRKAHDVYDNHVTYMGQFKTDLDEFNAETKDNPSGTS